MLFIQKLFTDPEAYFIWVILVVFSVCCHEYSHALVAKLQGDSTAEDNGYLTLNPFKQMGVTSLIALLLIGITWGAVPVNPSRMRHKYSHALVALCGPLMNLILFVIFTLGASVMYLKYGYMSEGIQASVFRLCFTGGLLNIVLLVFNLIPVPPLDGWTILTYIFPHIHRLNTELRNGIIFGLFILVFISFDKFFLYGSYVTIYIIGVFLPLLRSIGI